MAIRVPPKPLLDRLSKSSAAAIISHTHRRNQNQSLHACIALAPFRKNTAAKQRGTAKQNHNREEGTAKS